MIRITTAIVDNLIDDDDDNDEVDVDDNDHLRFFPAQIVKQ